MEHGPFEDVFPIEHGDIFHCYVSLPEGIDIFSVRMVDRQSQVGM